MRKAYARGRPPAAFEEELQNFLSSPSLDVALGSVADSYFKLQDYLKAP